MRSLEVASIKISQSLTIPPVKQLYQTKITNAYCEAATANKMNWHYFILERLYFDNLFSRWPAGEQEEPGSYQKTAELFTRTTILSLPTFPGHRIILAISTSRLGSLRYVFARKTCLFTDV